MNVVKVGGEEYDEVHPSAVAASKIIADFWIKLGRPQDPFTESGKKMMDIIIAVWEDCYPLQAKMWFAERADYQKNEMSAREQVRKGTGRSLASYPYPIFMMMKATFKGFDPGERKNCMKMVAQWPQFRMTNKV